jgi:ribonucleotide reductase beta subunit family protein with ferritin-like domain
LQLLQLRDVNLATHHHAEQMLSALKETEQVHVHVYLNISEILTLDVDQNVFKTVTATGRRHVLITNVKIPVQEFVE